VVFVKKPNNGADVYKVERFQGEGKVVESELERTLLILLFSDIAVMAGGGAIWNKSFLSYKVDHAMKKSSSRGLVPAWLPVRPYQAFVAPPCPIRHFGG